MLSFDEILYLVEKPARYIGGEFGLPEMKEKYEISSCIVFPDMYEIGMSNLGIKILYNIINSIEGVVCERCFAPWTDMGILLKENLIPLMSLESKKPLKDFDFLGFSIQYELLFSNVLYILDLAGIPFKSTERDSSFPLLIAGGPCTANPEPFADFFDVICIGEGEEVIVKVAEILKKFKGNKNRILEECAIVEGLYVPSIHCEEGRTNKKLIHKAVVKDLNSAMYPSKPIVPNITVVHDRPVAELYRGCYSNCRFCQASFFYRPIRKRDPEVLKKIILEMIDYSGTEEIGISSLSTGDYPCLGSLFSILLPEVEKRKVKLQLPSLRLDSFSPELIRNTRKTGSLTFAPEAGTQRLRNVINKNITDEDIDRTAKIAFQSGYKSVKLYFMLGLPSETEDDILGIAEIAKRIKRIYKEVTSKNDVNINISSSIFVPKPVTPFQWARQITQKEMIDKHFLLRKELKMIKGVNYSWSDENVSLLEGVFARGDKRLSKVIEEAYLMGAKFDSWNEHFNFDIWKDAFSKNNIDFEEYTSEKGLDDILPWSFIDFGVSDGYLKKEFQKSLVGVTTEGCRNECKGCGANRLGNCDTLGG
ncbi:MAG: TIGR03960 family B12-binding radical SAM protein [Clostridiales bacterium]|nr:TIGR03960 family B12-binding radical SAM protein [Clostridiales bacterium]